MTTLHPAHTGRFSSRTPNVVSWDIETVGGIPSGGIVYDSVSHQWCQLEWEWHPDLKVGEGVVTDLTWQRDPLWERGRVRCNNYKPRENWVCTRLQGHSGDHRAHCGDGIVCCPDWPNELDGLEVGEGL